MDILPVQENELPEVLAFAERTFRVAYEADNDPVFFEPYCQEAFTLQQFQKEWKHPFSSFWTGRLDGRLAAYMKLNYDNPHESIAGFKTVQVERIYVEPTLQGLGLGEKMLTFVYELAVKAKTDWIWLSVWQKNPRAVRFYERCGYEIFGIDMFDVGGDPQVDWAMRRRITSDI